MLKHLFMSCTERNDNLSEHQNVAAWHFFFYQKASDKMRTRALDRTISENTSHLKHDVKKKNKNPPPKKTLQQHLQIDAPDKCASKNHDPFWEIAQHLWRNLSSLWKEAYMQNMMLKWSGARRLPCSSSAVIIIFKIVWMFIRMPVIFTLQTTDKQIYKELVHLLYTETLLKAWFWLVRRTRQRLF